MMAIRFDYSKSGIDAGELGRMQALTMAAHTELSERSGAGNDFLGWLNLPTDYDKEEFARIKQAARRIQEKADVLVVIGIGGSYLGAKAVIDALNNYFYNWQSKEKRRTPQIVYAGNNISGSYLKQLVDFLEGKEVCLNVISKSGTTTEPAIAFRVLKNWMEEKYGKQEAAGRIFATTDKARGALRGLADKEGYETFVIADDIGGRYSVLTAVGLLPIAVSGIDIDELMRGAQAGQTEYSNADFSQNMCYQYAAARNILYNQGKTTEILVDYEPVLFFFAEWWKQLYGESEGKDHKGIFPAAVHFSTDLHSMGQYIQEGRRDLFETVIHIENSAADMTIGREAEDLDGLNYLSGQGFHFVNEKAFEGTLLAHLDGGTPNLLIHVEKLDAFHLGQLIYFFEKACAVSGYLLGVNPFDQPGVEAYKKNMFALLGKKGYEDLKAELEKRI
ncbi:glucose-6-phosphate isomerase [Lachnospiraceae bacterium oral taxon 500]|nr:glucose-6-phosphate isomerase [Lachnospiraceae bacterium oral taxon 500]